MYKSLTNKNSVNKNGMIVESCFFLIHIFLKITLPRKPNSESIKI